MKRLFDMICSFLLLLITLPIILIVSIIVRIKIGSPIIFKQQRPGYRSQPFMLYKFRTMANETEKNGQPLSHQERLTNTGRWLRKTSLDELPQLINVLKGDISLVGPRPLLMKYLPLYTRDQARRHEVKPGLTGWAQINGRNAISWEEKFDLDVWYVDNRSFVLDLKILVITFFKVFKREGVSKPGYEISDAFLGTKNKSTNG